MSDESELSKVVEFPDDRWRSRLPDSINNHSVRIYGYKGELFELDRTCDASPRFFELRRIHVGPGKPAPDHIHGSFYTENGVTHSFLELYQPEVILVNGNRYFGDGLSWGAAEIIAKLAIINWINGTDEVTP